ncbi:DUF255 domain-containing protein [Hahella sp. NBU794]|uniref:DUF255 domain-containing protein n=1 Tax=Hahella sp. NBU794 TaxID=3422590 RepID=UPI003D6E3804
MSASDPLQLARAGKQGSYAVRTRYRRRDGIPVYTNHLILEGSPYLLQHAHNPVNWRAWNDDTFALAKAENKPIFLSIGYSTCHWCHVMEEESFDNEEVAQTLNRYFIPIKVDREQRPDLDEIYMTAVQIITGHGGWPMSSFLTPEGKPFFGGTYFPRPRFISLLQRVHELWVEQQENLLEQGRRLSDAVSVYLRPKPISEALAENLIETAVEKLIGYSDREWGGFGSEPKFPQEPNLLFLLDIIERDSRPLDRQPAWSVVKSTLDALFAGGVYDQAGGGFHRYAVDQRWQVPHFEKMLYNQAQLARCYARAYNLSQNPEYLRVCRETLDYALREMRSPEGVFYSATDADSEGEEGKYFVWSYQELSQLLDTPGLALAEQVYGVTRKGNFEGANILHLHCSLQESAAALNLTYEELVQQLAELKATLLQARSQRIPPLRDDKVITEWNGMMIAALAETAAITGISAYGDAAVAAANQLWRSQRGEDGLFHRISLDNLPSDDALLEDYVHYMEGLLQLYDYTHDHLWLERMEALATTLEEQFLDAEQGGFFITPKNAQGPLLVRSKHCGDNATVSGNSQLASVLAALRLRTGDLNVQRMAENQIAAFTGQINRHPLSAPVFLKGLNEWLTPNPVNLQYAASGQMWAAVAVKEYKEDHLLEVQLDIHMSEGWRIQSHNCPAPDGRRTQVELLSHTDHDLLDIRYPPASVWTDPNESNALEVYDDHCRIELTLRRSTRSPVRLALHFQTCNEQVCHRPHTLNFSFW